MRIRRSIGAIVLSIAVVLLVAGCPTDLESNGRELPVLSDTHPNTFINAAEIRAIRWRVAAGSSPWRTAYDALIERAEAALDQEVLSVTFQGSTSNDYFTQRPYDWSNNMPSPCGETYCDGHINPEADRGDYEAAIAVGRSVRDLAVAYVLTGKNEYADKAITLLLAWTVDPVTRMTPRYPNTQSRIELSITMPGLFYGADLIYEYPGWNPAEKALFLQWVDEFTSDARTSWSGSNNFENWRLVVVSTGGALLKDQDHLDYAFERWRNLISDQIGSDGRILTELNRTRSLEYSTFAMNAMTQTAEVARQQGVNLYDYVDENGRGLELVFDFHASYMLDPTQWPYEQVTPYDGENAAIMELAFSFKQKQQYLDTILAWGRPMYEDRVMGITTLTHAFRGVH